MDLDARLTATQAAEAIGVSKQLVNYWRQRGHVQPNEHGLYRLGDVLAADARARRSGYSRRALTSA